MHLERETGNFVAGLGLGPQRGWHDAHEVVTREAIHVEGGGTRVPGRMVVYVMRRRDQASDGFAAPLYVLLDASGRVKKKLVPRPGLLSTSIVPPCASTIPFTMANPSPAPRVSARPACQKRSKMWGI